MSDNKNNKIKKNIKFTDAEIKILMKNFDKKTYDVILEKEIIRQLGNALLNQYKKFKLLDLIMLICGLLGGFGIASCIFGFTTGLFGGG